MTRYFKQISWWPEGDFAKFMRGVDFLIPRKPFPPSWSKKGFIKKSKESAPLVRIPIEVWQDLMAMSHLAVGEYSTFLEIDHNEQKNEYNVLSWYLPFQDASWAHVKLTQEGAVKLAVEALDRLPQMYGVFHIHPSRHTPGSDLVAGFSSVDYDAMWKWVSNAKRGVFIVSHIGGGAKAELCTEVDGVRHLVDMDIEINIGVEDGRLAELTTMMAERVGRKQTVWAKFVPKKGVHKPSPGKRWPYTDPRAWDWREWHGYDPIEDHELDIVDLTVKAIPIKASSFEIGDLVVVKKDTPIVPGTTHGISYMVTEVGSGWLYIMDLESKSDIEWCYLTDEVEKVTAQVEDEFDRVERAMIIHDVSPEDVKRLEDLRELMR